MNDKIRRFVGRVARTLDVIAALVVLLLIVLAVSGPPRGIVDWLEMPELAPQETPRNIVVLGGGGIPSGSTLLRTYYAAQYGKNLTGTTFVVSLPADGNPETSSVGRMQDELVLRGVPSSAIRMEYRGLNTHEQAVNVQRLLGPEALGQPILIVTSGYHMRRAVSCFRKLGFTKVSGLLASDIGAEAEIGPWGWLRYGVWSHLEREIRISRELAALATYRLEGWI
ncbi:MAG TPA: YdcF family protein [Verrucomicrobiae bacterium]|nr:YdcF family protein [Verrucomicrobiae bacterium]